MSLSSLLRFSITPSSSPKKKNCSISLPTRYWLKSSLAMLIGSTLATATLVSSTHAQTATTSPCTTTGNSSTNLAVCSASYLGGTGSDTAAAVEVAPDRSIILAGTLINSALPLAPTFLQVTGSPAQGNGTIVRLDATGRSMLSVTRLGNTIDDMDVDRRTGNIVTVGDYGVAVLNPQARQVVWSQGLGAGGGATASTGRRVAVGSAGQIATLFGKRVKVFDAAGKVLGQFNPAGTYVEDIAIDSASSSVIVTGYSQKDGGGCSQLQVAFIRSYSYTGTLKWTNYDWRHSQAYSRSSCADSRGMRIAIGRDNMLYFAGESAGGNSIFRYSPRNLATNAPNVKYDPYTDPYNTSSNHIIYYGRFVPATGEQRVGQFLLSRLSSGKGNTIRPRAISADELGNVYVGGFSGASIANRNPVNLTISGQRIGNYSGGDGFLLIASPDLRTRRIWTAWSGANTTTVSTTIAGLSVFQGSAAIVSTSNGNMITVNPLQPQNRGGSDVFFSVFPARTQ